jgi:hypothetical protein
MVRAGGVLGRSSSEEGEAIAAVLIKATSSTVAVGSAKGGGARNVETTRIPLPYDRSSTSAKGLSIQPPTTYAKTLGMARCLLTEMKLTQTGSATSERRIRDGMPAIACGSSHNYRQCQILAFLEAPAHHQSFFVLSKGQRTKCTLKNSG